MNVSDDLTVPISAIEHFAYCPRQCALIHVEQVFEENVYTIRGSLAHERVDSGVPTVEEGVRFVRGLPLWSESRGLTGKADLVEFRAESPYPVEYKVGPRKGRYAEFQLCAQGLCLEEMFGVPVTVGAVFHRASASRKEVALDDRLRTETLDIVRDIRRILRETELPPAVNDARCRRCSLQDACLPSIVASAGTMTRFESQLFTPMAIPDDA